MKRLYLVRHAKSSWKDGNLADDERPLNKRGKRDAPLMGKLFAERGYSPDLIVSSPAVRAITTARMIARELGYPRRAIAERQDIYLASDSELRDVIRRTEDSAASLMLFGHNPGLTELANSLTAVRVDNVPTCGLFCAEFGVGSWREVGGGSGVFVCFEYPKKHLP